MSCSSRLRQRFKVPPKAQPRARLPLGVSTSACQAHIAIIGTLQSEIKVTEESACRSSSSDSYQARECCGPDGIRTRTFTLDRLICCPLHHGPWLKAKAAGSVSNGASLQNLRPCSDSGILRACSFLPFQHYFARCLDVLLAHSHSRGRLAAFASRWM